MHRHAAARTDRATSREAKRSHPIGVYDSGVGGLSVLRALKAALPGESFIYVADSGHAPYGDRATAHVESRAHEVVDFLAARGAQAVVLACNTASVVASRELRARHPMPIVAMEPAIKPAAQLTRSGVVLVLATTTTVQSASVAALCEAHGAGRRIVLQACPGLADQVERGRFHDADTRALLQRYLAPGLAEGADTIVLGCTHYAFLADEIARIAGPAVRLVESSDAIARQLARVLPTPVACAAAAGDAPATVYYSSGSPQELREFLAAIGEPCDGVQRLP